MTNKENPQRACPQGRASAASSRVVRRWALGLVYWAAATLGAGCMPQPRGEIESLRAELKALALEVETLKAQRSGVAVEAAPAPAPVAGETPGMTPRSSVPWAERKQAFDKEKVDHEWARIHQSALLKLGVKHIEGQGATLQSVVCKTTACLLIVDAPNKRSPPYEPLLNPWADTEFVANQESLYNDKIRWSYLLVRHPEDDPKFGARRVNPLDLALARAKQLRTPASAASAAPAGQPAGQPVAQVPTSPLATQGATTTPVQPPPSAIPVAPQAAPVAKVSKSTPPVTTPAAAPPGKSAPSVPTPPAAPSATVSKSAPPTPPAAQAKPAAPPKKAPQVAEVEEKAPAPPASPAP